MDILDKCNDYMYEYGDCVDWNMRAYCVQNKHYTFRDLAIYDDNGNILDDNYAYVITDTDLMNACVECGIDISILAEYYGYSCVDAFLCDMQKYPNTETVDDVTYIVRMC